MHYTEAKGILSAQNGMNTYRGCTHGCIYCDSRSVCYDMKHDFEDIEVKSNAPELLESALRSKRRRCMIGTGAMSDPYNPLEGQLEITRKCLEIINKYGFGVALQTKSASLLRDMELFCEINRRSKCVIQMTLTCAEDSLAAVVEPHVSPTSRRADALKLFAANGIPTVAWLSPFLPFINDTKENLRGLLDMCFDAGVKGIIFFGAGLTLRDGNREYFYDRLDEAFPGLKMKYIEKFGNSYECMSDNSPALSKIFHEECEKRGVLHSPEAVFSYMREFEDKNQPQQLSLF